MRVNILAVAVATLLLSVPLVSAVVANNNSFCVTTNGNQSFNLNPIAAAVYSGTMVADNGVTPVAVNFGWCGTINSTACNVTNWGMSVETTFPSSCVTEFEVFLGPITITNGTVGFQMWGGIDGAIATVSVTCNPSGVSGTAQLTGLIVNEPIYSYELAFSSVHACPVAV